MDQARIFIAILLSFLVFFVWDALFGTREAVRPPATAPASQAEKIDSGPPPAVKADASSSGVPDATPAAASPSSPASGQPTRTISVENRYYRLVIDERGGTVRSVELKQYRQSVQDGAPAHRLVGEEVAGGTLQLGLSAEGGAALAQALFSAETSADRLVVDQAPQSLVLTHWRSDGIGIEKRFTFQPDSYLIDLDVTVKNSGPQALSPQLWLALSQAEDTSKGARYGFSGPSILIDDHLSQIDVDDIEEQGRLEGKIGWIAIQDRYFLSAVVPPPVSGAAVQLGHQDAVIQSALVLPPETLAPGEARTYTYRVFFGAKRS
ncbi:MAG: membrane protein insertase YidC, partial [Desulfobacteraceae bacterium]|nr:membrane protein insertase YidC [Desulfobacteraceae bacterium]